MTTTPETLPDSLTACAGCGTTKSLEEIRQKHPNARSCCPEREMVEWVRADTRPAPVSVKPLEWHNRVQRFTCSEPGPMSYSIMEGHNRVYGIPGEHDGAAEFASIDEAKDAAQQHYAASIFSAIQPAPAVERLAAAVRDMQDADERFQGEIPVRFISAVYAALADYEGSQK